MSINCQINSCSHGGKNVVLSQKTTIILQDNAVSCNSSEIDGISSAQRCAIVCTKVAVSNCIHKHKRASIPQEAVDFWSLKQNSFQLAEYMLYNEVYKVLLILSLN